MAAINFTIESTLRTKVPKVRLGIITCDIHVSISGKDQLSDFKKVEDRMRSILDSLPEKDWPTVSASRAAYKLCGKDPSRYRPSAELLLRRVRTGKELPTISNVVDVINIVSMKTGFSIGGFDREKVVGDVILSVGDDQSYATIGGRDLNIEGMPAVRDERGYFGTPTSDSGRTMITEHTSKILIAVYDFGSDAQLDSVLEMFSDLLTKWCSATNINRQVIIKGQRTEL